MNTTLTAISRGCVQRIKATGLRAAKADKAALEYINGAAAAVSAIVGEDHPDSIAVQRKAFLVSTRGFRAVLDTVEAADAADAAARGEDAANAA